MKQFLCIIRITRRLNTKKNKALKELHGKNMIRSKKTKTKESENFKKNRTFTNLKLSTSKRTLPTSMPSSRSSRPWKITDTHGTIFPEWSAKVKRTVTLWLIWSTNLTFSKDKLQSFWAIQSVSNKCLNFCLSILISTTMRTLMQQCTTIVKRKTFKKSKELKRPVNRSSN